MGWFKSVKNPKLKITNKQTVSNTPSGLWKKCNNCKEIVQNSKLEESYHVCPYCDHHFRLNAKSRIELLVDEDSFKSYITPLTSNDPFQFVDKKSYAQRLVESKNKTGLDDGTFCGEALIDGTRVSIGVMNFEFMGGSMGVVTGEKLALVMEKALEYKIPALIVCASGGARMQEGLLSLMQMGKTSALRQRLKNNCLPFISLLTDPTTGGVAASFAMLGDINIAEPGALIGFAGPRVIEQSIRQVLPVGFQRSEFLLEHGFIDRIIHRHKLKEEISFFMNIFTKQPMQEA